jgi:hypothetical protein
VLSSMIDVKVDHLFSIGRTFDARIFAALKPWLMRGLPEVQTQNDGKESEQWGGRDRGSGLGAALRLFRWRSDTTEALETKRTGVGMMFWAALNDNVEAVLELESMALVSAVSSQALRIDRGDLFGKRTRGVVNGCSYCGCRVYRSDMQKFH